MACFILTSLLMVAAIALACRDVIDRILVSPISIPGMSGVRPPGGGARRVAPPPACVRGRHPRQRCPGRAQTRATIMVEAALAAKSHFAVSKFWRR
jgi:hypothetical protein